MSGNQSHAYLAALAAERHHRFIADAQHAHQLALLDRGPGGSAWQRVSYGLSASALPGAFRLGSWRTRRRHQPRALLGETGTTTIVRPGGAYGLGSR
jgi:hypothetical protein